MALELLGASFSDLKGRSVTFPIGNTGNSVRAVYTIQNEFRVELSNSIQITKVGNKFTLSSGSWSNYGLVTAAPISFDLLGSTNISGPGNVQFIDGADLFLVSDPDSGVNNVTYFAGFFKQFRTPEGIDFAFNIPSNDAPGQNSLIDGEPTLFTIDNLNFTAVGTTLQMTQLGNRSGMSEIVVNITMLADGLGDKSKFLIDVLYRYPHYKFPELFTLGNSVAPWAKFKTLAEYANPNIGMSKVYQPIGNIGYFGEHFNGGPASYFFQSINWKRTNNTVIPAMDYSQISKFEIIVSGVFDSACQFNIGWFWDSLNESEWKNLPESHDRNIMLVTKTTANSTIFGPETILGYPNSTGAKIDITNLSYTLVGPTQLKITGRTEPNTEFTEWFDEREGDRGYKMWIDCDGSAFNGDWNSSTSINVQVADAQMVKSAVILGIWDDIQYSKFLDHNDDQFDSPTVYTEDDLNHVILFKMPKNIPYQSIGGSIVAFNPLSSESFVLESQIVNITPSVQLPFINGALPINYTQSRGFKLPNGSGKNEIKLTRYPINDSVSHFALKFNYGFLCRWETWLQQLNATPYFFATPNKNWQQFQGAGWQLKFVFNVTKEAGSYENSFPFRIKAYDDYIGTSQAEFFLLDGTQVNAPDASSPVRVKFTHELNNPYAWDPDYWANMTVEPFEGGPRWLLSSRPFTLDGQNPLYPLAGETGVKITVVGDQAVTECLFDPLKIAYNNLSFTGRIQGNEVPEIEARFIFQNGNGVLNQDDNNLIPQ